MLGIFFRNYLFIVIAIISVSAILERALFNTDDNDQYIQLLAESIVSITSAAEINTPKSNDKFTFSRLPFDQVQFSDSQIKDLQKDGYLVSYSMNDTPTFYHQLSKNELLVTEIKLKKQNSNIEFWYRSLFFLVLALLVAAWSWPLWRDIKKLEVAASNLGSDGKLSSIKVTTASLNVIADAFVNLSNKVRRLLANQRELTSAVAHEIRTPMARLKFSIESMSDASLKTSMMEDLNELDLLTQEMLDYAHTEHQKPELVIAEISVFDMVESLLSALPQSRVNHLTLTNHCDPLILYADGHLVERATLNLLNNATKYAREAISVSCQSRHDSIEIIVEDDGPGVPEEVHKKIFDAFFRPDKSRTRHKGGAGLGLAIVKKIQDWHQGECWVENSPNGGARFVLQYPKGDHSQYQ